VERQFPGASLYSLDDYSPKTPQRLVIAISCREIPLSLVTARRRQCAAVIAGDIPAR
jgi:hypothetical protein